MGNLCKKVLTIIVIIINCFGIFGECITSSSNAEIPNNTPTKNRLEKIKEKGVLTVASANNRPFAYIDPKTNEFSGIDADILIELARRFNINKVEMKYVPFADLLKELNTNDTIDVAVSGIYITDERKKDVLFTNILYKEPEAVITPKATKYNFKEDLKTAVIGATTGTVFESLVEKWKQEGLVKDIKLYESQDGLILAIATGEVDAGMIDSLAASYVVSNQKNLNLKILSAYKPEFSGSVGVALKKEDTDFAEAMNKELDKMKIDNTLTSILKKYSLSSNA